MRKIIVLLLLVVAGFTANAQRWHHGYGHRGGYHARGHFYHRGGVYRSHRVHYYHRRAIVRPVVYRRHWHRRPVVSLRIGGGHRYHRHHGRRW